MKHGPNGFIEFSERWLELQFVAQPIFCSFFAKKERSRPWYRAQTTG